VAAFADRHHRVEKRVSGGRTHAGVVHLDGEDERRREVARMMAGATITDAAIAHAGALILAARSGSPARGARAVQVRAAARRAAVAGRGAAVARGSPR
jgi:DNA repair protein RecN (Recombination protein N)